MEKIKNWEIIDTKSAKTSAPTPGAYVVQITSVEDKKEYQSLVIQFEIIEGEYANYYGNLVKEGKANRSSTWRSYKEGWGEIFFKKFIEDVENSNMGYVFDFHEQSLVGKKVVALFGSEEYVKNDTINHKVEILTVVRCQDWCSVPEYRENKYKLPKARTLTEAQRKAYEELKAKYEGSDDSVPSIDDDEELPF